MSTLFTIGYEGLSIEKFLAMVGEHPIDMIVDARERPISRKPGFSKRALQESLEQLGLDYVHIPELGSPTTIRRQFKESGEWEVFGKEYSGWLEVQRDSINAIHGLARRHTIGVLCFEADVNMCHRSILGARLLEFLEGYIWMDLSRHGTTTLDFLSSSSRIRARATHTAKQTALQDCLTVSNGYDCIP